MPDRPTISFLIPTFDPTRPLARAIGSIARQLLPGDEVLCIGDIRNGPIPSADKSCREFSERGYNVKYLEFDAGHPCWGHEQVNYGFDNASGDLLCVNDDDDIWTSIAAFDIRCAATYHPDKPMLFKFQSYTDGVIWREKGLIQRDHIGGHCLVQPNIPDKIGKMACTYNGDFDMIHECLMAHGGYDSAVWVDKIIAIARP